MTDSTAGSTNTGAPTDTTSECPHGRDPSTTCTECFFGRDSSTDCVACLPGMYQPGDRVAECVTVPRKNINELACACMHSSGHDHVVSVAVDPLCFKQKQYCDFY